ncbi:hypothetical protein [Ktedonobacter robiniae]|uniref:Gram-positive cocci surface proteins LPxTG domain-containing protein n=1 Tax=Ktedonobacter robiniae TaxID=2778365 RepID=A0ABQ3UN07_9CHLR|nr:hypothetical protein [Ktedonobacter robiniae]GHO54141.1 hypothetical protein KSB_26160 [Ktedonobacter robiniae]
MIDTMLALWNQKNRRRGAKFFVTFMFMCICASMLCVIVGMNFWPTSGRQGPGHPANADQREAKVTSTGTKQHQPDSGTVTPITPDDVAKVPGTQPCNSAATNASSQGSSSDGTQANTNSSGSGQPSAPAQSNGGGTQQQYPPAQGGAQQYYPPSQALPVAKASNPPALPIVRKTAKPHPTASATPTVTVTPTGEPGEDDTPTVDPADGDQATPTISADNDGATPGIANVDGMPGVTDGNGTPGVTDGNGTPGAGDNNGGPEGTPTPLPSITGAGDNYDPSIFDPPFFWPHAGDEIRIEIPRMYWNYRGEKIRYWPLTCLHHTAPVQQTDSTSDLWLRNIAFILGSSFIATVLLLGSAYLIKHRKRNA